MKATKLVIGASLLIAMAAVAMPGAAAEGIVQDCNSQLLVLPGEGTTFSDCAQQKECEQYIDTPELFRNCVLGV